MKSVLLVAAASLTLLTSDEAQAQNSSRHQPVRTTRTQAWRHRTTTRTDNGNHKGWEQGRHEGWQEVTDTNTLRYGGYTRKKAPIRTKKHNGRQRNGT